jgi:hypothetical protein
VGVCASYKPGAAEPGGDRRRAMAIAWRRDPDEALSDAKLRGRHVLFDFSTAPT